MKEMIEKIWETQKILILIGVFLFVVLIVFWQWSLFQQQPIAEESIKKTNVIDKKEEGYLLGEEIDKKAFVTRLEEQYHHIKIKQDETEQQIERMKSLLRLFSEKDEERKKQMEQLKEKVIRMQKQIRIEKKQQKNDEQKDYSLEIVSLGTAQEEIQEVFLPAGSFVKGVLMTGAYAPAEQKSPLPVLIRLVEDFYGPNETKIPLKGSFIIGKATGDINSQRALIQAVGLSVVLPDGKTFQTEGNIGYVTDVYGQLGLQGRVVHHTGGKMAASFLSGFMSGASGVMANQEITTFKGEEGKEYYQITDEASKRAGLGGMSESARQMASYYQKQAESIIPAVMINPGSEIYLVVLEGVKINGLKKAQILQNDSFMLFD